MDKAININGISNGSEVRVASADERPIDTIEDWAEVGITLMHKSVVIYRGDDGPEIGIAGMNESIYVYGRYDRAQIRIASADEAPSLPIAIIRFVVCHK